MNVYDIMRDLARVMCRIMEKIGYDVVDVKKGFFMKINQIDNRALVNNRAIVDELDKIIDFFREINYFKKFDQFFFDLDGVWLNIKDMLRKYSFSELLTTPYIIQGFVEAQSIRDLIPKAIELNNYLWELDLTMSMKKNVNEKELGKGDCRRSDNNFFFKRKKKSSSDKESENYEK